ncbi:MAG: hypothetical protein Q7S59_10545 [Sulfurimonas sp.]|nr:hypothetical protein [Sulfurimonas sp.]
MHIELFIFEIDKFHNRGYMTKEDFDEGLLRLLDASATFFHATRNRSFYE